MTTVDLGGARYVVVGAQRIMIFANKGILGTLLSADQMEEIADALTREAKELRRRTIAKRA